MTAATASNEADLGTKSECAGCSFVSDLSTKWRSWEIDSSADWSTALEREAVIPPLVEQLRLSQAIIENAAERLQGAATILVSDLSTWGSRAYTI